MFKFPNIDELIEADAKVNPALVKAFARLDKEKPGDGTPKTDDDDSPGESTPE